MRRPPRHVRIGWFGGIASAIAGSVVGVVLVFASLALLWWNEGRPNLADVAGDSRPAPADRVDPGLNGAFVSVTGVVDADGALADHEYLRAGPYATLARGAEMFAWSEHRVDRGRRGEEFRYTRGWTEAPPDSQRFRDPRGHENPPMRIRSARWALRDASVARYHFAPSRAVMPRGEPLVLTPDMLVPDAPNAPRVDRGVMFVGTGTLDVPDVGDLRVHYEAYGLGRQATLFGEQHDDVITPHLDDRAEVYRLVPGGRDQALRALDAEHRLTRWILRMVGLLVLWTALNLCLAPLSAMFDVIPPLGRASRGTVALVTLPIAVGVGGVAIVVSAVVHSTLGFILMLVALGVLAWLVVRRGWN